MNTSASTRDNSSSDLNILFKVGDRVFDKRSITQFVYENELNRRPKGSFVVKDTGGLLSDGLESGSYGVLYFTNTADEKTEKASALMVYVESVETIERTNLFYWYRVQFSAGTLSQMNVRTGDIILQSNSVDALRKICEVRKTAVLPYSGSIKPSDTMNWILVHRDMWSQLEMVVSRSFLPNDYVFWAWDDVNNAFVISSILTEKSKTSKHVFIKSMDSLSSTNLSKQYLDSPEKVIWSYSAYKKSNQLGSVYSRLFPNVSFLGLPSGTIPSGGIRKKNFISLLKATNDTKIDDILTKTGLGAEDAVYGALQIKKHNLNGHDMYAFSDVYRDYKLATYAKVFVCQIYNSIGPSIGSFVTAINTESTTDGNFQLDERFSDKYMILKKRVEYIGRTRTRTGKEVDAVTNFVTTLVLVSDNYGNGIEHTDALEKSVRK